MNSLKQVSSTVLKDIKEINNGILDVIEIVELVSTYSISVGLVSDDLDHQIHQFKTDYKVQESNIAKLEISS